MAKFSIGDIVGVKMNHSLRENGVHRIVDVRYINQGRHQGRYVYLLCCHNINGHCGEMLWWDYQLVKREGPVKHVSAPPDPNTVELWWQCILMTDDEYHGKRWNQPIAKRTRNRAPHWYKEREEGDNEEKEEGDNGEE